MFGVCMVSPMVDVFFNLFYTHYINLHQSSNVDCVWSSVLNSFLGQVSFVSFLRVASSLCCLNMILASFLRFNEKEDVLDSIYGMFGLTEYRNTECCIMGDTNGISVIQG